MKKESERIGKSRFKLIYAISQMVIFFLAISIFPSYWVLAVLLMMISYLVPFYINSYNVKFLSTGTKLSTFYLEDTLFYYLPSLALCLVFETILRLIHVVNIFDNYLLFTLIFFISFTLLTLFQWLKLFLLNFNMKRIRNAKEAENLYENEESEDSSDNSIDYENTENHNNK